MEAIPTITVLVFVAGLATGLLLAILRGRNGNAKEEFRDLLALIREARGRKPQESNDGKEEEDTEP